MPTTVITGPCILKWNSIVFFTEGDVSVEMDRKTFDLVSSQHGMFDSRHKYSVIKVSFTPTGATDLLINAILAEMTGKSPGQSMVPQGTGLEKSLVIQPMTNAGGASRIWTFLRAGITSGINLKLSAGKQVFGPLTFTCLVSTVTANTFFTTAVYAAPASGDLDDFNNVKVLTMPCEAVWADVPGTLASGDLVMTSVDGWEVNVNLTTQEHEREAMGMADVTLKDCTASMSGQAANIFDHTGALIPEQSWAALMPFQTVLPGQQTTRKKMTLRTLTADSTTGTLDVGAGETILTMAKAEMEMQGLAWGAGPNRTGNVRFKSVPVFASGVRGALISQALI